MLEDKAVLLDGDGLKTEWHSLQVQDPSDINNFKQELPEEQVYQKGKPYRFQSPVQKRN